MHEYQIVEIIVSSVIARAKEQGMASVKNIILKISELAGLEESSVRLYFQEIAKATILENAQLDIQTLPAQLKCKKCGIVFSRVKGQFNCPECGELASPLPAEKFSFEIS